MPRPTPIRVVHALVFAVALIVSILDLAEQFAGAPLAAALAVPVAALVIGMCREPSGRAGWRPILVAADIAIAVATGAQLFLPTFGRGIGPAQPVTAALLALALAALATVLLAGRHGTAERLVRARTQRVILAVLVLVAIATALGPIIALRDSAVSLDNLLSITAASLARSGVLIVLWWWGSPWLLVLAGVTTVVGNVEVARVLEQPFAITNSLLLAALAILAVVFRPREAGPSTGAAAVGRAGRRAPAAAVWLIMGAALFVPAVYLGLYPPILIDCFDRCPRPMPGAQALLAIDTVLLFVVPLAALAIALAPGHGPVLRRFGPVIALAGAAFVLVQVGFGLVGLSPFAFLPAAAPAPVLIVLGVGAAILRPGWLLETSRVAALAAGLAATTWIWSGIAVGPFELPLIQVMGIAAGAAVAVVLARESRKRMAPSNVAALTAFRAAPYNPDEITRD